MNLNNGYEIERKFLIAYPDITLLKSQSGCSSFRLSQFYLSSGGRMRKIEKDGKISYIKTVKQHITDIKRQESEWEVSQGDYIEALKDIKEGTSVIEKVRYCIPFLKHTLEIDIFPFWNDRAFLEIELKDENEDIVIPDYITVIKEVTDDKRYRNSALARNIITEDL